MSDFLHSHLTMFESSNLDYAQPSGLAEVAIFDDLGEPPRTVAELKAATLICSTQQSDSP